MENDGYVYCEARKGMYVLKQEASPAFENLIKLLSPHGYFTFRESTGLWKHQARPTVFTLCVDNFDIKSNSTEDTHHFINDIKKYFKLSIDWKGQNYLGLTLDSKYTKSTLIYPCLYKSQTH